MNKLKIYILLREFAIVSIMVLSIASCTSKKVFTKEKKHNSLELYEKIKESDLDFNWYKINADIDVYLKGYNVSGKTEIRMKKNEFIWLNIKKFGMEFGRILIRPDSFYVLDRFNKSYTSNPIDSLRSQYKIPFQFNDFQDLLIGNSLISTQKPVNSQIGEKGTLLKTNGEKFDIIYKLDDKLRVESMRMKDIKNNNVDVDFSDYRQQYQKEIPYIRKYSYPDNKEPEYFFKMKLKKVEKDVPFKIKFEIPENYDRL